MASFSGILSGVFTALLLVVFIGIVVWAYSSRRRSTFEDAARLPLEEDSGAIPPGSGQQQS